MKLSLLTRHLFFLSLCSSQLVAQPGTRLDECLRLARERNISIEQARRSLTARQYQLRAEEVSYLPKLDLLAGYNYLGKPLEINLQTVRNGIVNGSSAQSTAAAGEVFKEITGNDMPQNVRDRIQQISKDAINGIYPNYNPPLSKQQYFTAALGLRQPIYLGGKLNTARDIAKATYESGVVNVELVQKELDFLVAATYIRILYLNTILRSQAAIVEAMSKNEQYAAAMVKQELIPPYLRNWATVALAQAITRQHNQELEKTNALIEMRRLLQLPQDSALEINDTLRYAVKSAVTVTDNFWLQNATYKSINSKTALAESAVKASKSLSMPNIFGIASLNLYQNDLPVTIPPWLVGVEAQWTIFSGLSNYRKRKATEQLVEEARLAAENTKYLLQAGAAMAHNKVTALEKDIEVLNMARVQAQTSTSLIQQRVKEELSSVKDVNESLLVEEEIGKTYYTAVLGYYLALAEYYNIIGTPEKIASVIQ
ncbi:TolC family protein [uncultured Chitinophaga sp.]|uniref:TolC family protein n=1 Tax=uncultured Chitinophaga sp. TaxID=339340 RepID=UPI0025DCAD95|nr:TolC family protein [uncultured Chitinophaga sp.]